MTNSGYISPDIHAVDFNKYITNQSEEYLVRSDS